MNATEKNYLMKRIDQLERDKTAKWRSALDKTKIFRTRYELVKTGKVKLRKDINKSCSNSFSEYDFSKYPEAQGRPYYETPKEIVTKVTELKDKVMLGSSEEAMKLLAEFEKWSL